MQVYGRSTRGQNRVKPCFPASTALGNPEYEHRSSILLKYVSVPVDDAGENCFNSDVTKLLYIELQL